MKKYTYNSRVEGLILSIIGFFGCSSLIYGILTNRCEKDNNLIVISFILCSVLLLFGLWRLIKGRAKDYIDTSGFLYSLYNKYSKCKFIIVSGLLEMLYCYIVVILVGFFEEEITVRYIFYTFLSCIFLSPIAGFITYKKYSSKKIV